MKNLCILLFISVLFSCNKKQSEQVTPKTIEVIKEVTPEVEEMPELIFTVQVAALRKENGSLISLANVKTYNENGLTKYRFGAFKTYAEANQYKKKLSKNYRGSFVQAIKNGKPIPIETALNN